MAINRVPIIAKLKGCGRNFKSHIQNISVDKVKYSIYFICSNLFLFIRTITYARGGKMKQVIIINLYFKYQGVSFFNKILLKTYLSKLS